MERGAGQRTVGDQGLGFRVSGSRDGGAYPVPFNAFFRRVELAKSRRDTCWQADVET